jgi:hypothetical protein
MGRREQLTLPEDDRQRLPRPLFNGWINKTFRTDAAASTWQWIARSRSASRPTSSRG